MALNVRNDKNLSRLLRVNVNERRLFFWLQPNQTFKVIYEKYAKINSYDSVLESLHSIICSDKNLLSSLRLQAHNTLLQDKDLGFLYKDKRLVEWTRMYMTGAMPFTGGFAWYGDMDSLDYVLSKIDLWGSAIAQKKDYILNLKNEWENYLAQDNITKWLQDKNEASICEHAWECIARSFTTIPIPKYRINNKTDLLMFLDQISANKYEQMVLIRNIKNGWNQKKYREKLEGKKQCNLLLSQKGINRLAKLSKQYDLGKSEIIEILLQMEEQEKHYIRKKMFILEHAADEYLAKLNATEGLDGTLPARSDTEESNVEQAIDASNEEANQPPGLSIDNEEPY